MAMLCGRRALLDYRDRLKGMKPDIQPAVSQLVQVPDAVEKLKK